MKLLIDMNLWPGWVPYLAACGIEAEHWSAIGAATAPDAEIAAYARDHGFVIITQDVDFATTLVTGEETKPSIIQIRSDECRS